MTVEWDIYKAIANWFKHGVSFNQGVTALEDPNALITLNRAPNGEERFQLIGKGAFFTETAIAPMIVVVYTLRGNETKRIISVRTASRQERKAYEREI